MAKRFISTDIFSDSWFSELSPHNKLFYVYLFTNCDHAGVIDLNPRLAEFETGIKGLAKSYQTVTKQLGNRLIRLRDNYYCLPKFVKFQYPKGLNTNVKAQLSVVNRLAEFDLDYNSLLTVTKQLDNSSLTVQDKDIDKDIDIETDKKKEKKSKEFIPPTKQEFWAYCKSEGFPHVAERAFKGYDVADWHDASGNKIKNWKQKLQNGWFKNSEKQTPPPPSYAL